LLRPRVHSVLGRKTAYISGRRLLLPADFSLDDAVKLTNGPLPPKDPKLRDSIGQMLVSKDIIPEPLANAIGLMFSPLLARRRFALASLLLVGLNIVILALFWDRLGLLQPSLVWRGTYLDFLLPYVAFSLIVLWHEFGHCAAARRCGIRVDTMGAGFLLIFPTLFTKVSLVKLLSRRDRLIVFLGGIYFQLIASIFLLVFVVATHNFLAKSLFFFNLTIALFNLVPIMKLDGYRVAMEIADKYNMTAQSHPLFFRVLTVFSFIYFGYVAFYLWISIRAGYHNVVIGKQYGGAVFVAFQVVVLCLIVRHLVLQIGIRK
jgi:Zn-dependent protease